MLRNPKRYGDEGHSYARDRDQRLYFHGGCSANLFVTPLPKSKQASFEKEFGK